MAAGTRGKLKEDLVGVHRNCDWIMQHCQRCLSLIGDDHPELIVAFEGLHTLAKTLDDLAQGLYSTI